MKNKLIKGAIFVTVATFLVKILSIVYKVPYQNITGDKGFYIYQQMYPIYALFALSGSFAFPLALSEKIKTGQKNKILTSTFYLLVVMGVMLSIVIILYKSTLALIFNDLHLASLFIPLVPLLLILPLISVIRGYLYSDINKINQVGISIIIEQIIRVGYIIVILYLFVNNYISDVYSVGEFSFWGFSIGIFLTLFYLMFKFDFKQIKFIYYDISIGISIMKRAFFLLISSAVLLFFQLVDSLTIIEQLSMLSDIGHAMNAKGVYDRGLPIIQATVFFVSPLLASIIPHISKRVDYTRLFMLILFISMPATLGLIIVLEDINILLFLDNQYTNVLRVSALIVLLYSVFLTLSAITKSNKKLFWIIISGIFVKWLGNVILIRNFGIVGASISSVISLLLMIIIIIGMNYKKLNFSILLIGKILVSNFIMYICIYYLSSINETFNKLFSKILIGVIVYLITAFILIIKKEQLLIVNIK